MKMEQGINHWKKPSCLFSEALKQLYTPELGKNAVVERMGRSWGQLDMMEGGFSQKSPWKGGRSEKKLIC